MNLLLENNSVIQRVLQKAFLGIWTIELRPDHPPRMHVDKTMMELLGIGEQLTPEECYRIWYDNVDPAYKDAVDTCIRSILKKEKADIQYRWHHPVYGWRYVRCGGELAESKEQGIYMAGYHQDVTDRISIQREKECIEQLYNDVTSSMGKMFDGILRISLTNGTVLVIQSLHFPELIGQVVALEEYLKHVSEYMPPQEFERVKGLLSFDHIHQMKSGGQEYFTAECYTKTKSEGTRWYAFSIFSDEKDSRNENVIVAVQDINMQKRSEEENSKTIEQLRYHAQRDSLTGLYNRAAAKKCIDCYLEVQKKEEISSLMIVDLDNFKSVNDTLGHVKGDEVLVEMANILREHFRERDVIGRMGGDEFIVFMQGVRSLKEVYRVAGHMTRCMQRIYTGKNGTVEVSGSVGIALCPTHGKSYQKLYQCADMALYQAKRNGKNGFALYEN